MAVTQELQKELPGSNAALKVAGVGRLEIKSRTPCKWPISCLQPAVTVCYIAVDVLVCVSCELSLEDYELVFVSCTFAMNFAFTFVNFQFVSFRPHSRNETKYVDTCGFS